MLKNQNGGEKENQRRQVTMLQQWQFFVCLFFLFCYQPSAFFPSQKLRNSSKVWAVSVCLYVRSFVQLTFCIYAHKTSGKFDVDKGDNCHQLRCSVSISISVYDFSLVELKLQFKRKTSLLIEIWVEH